MIHSLMNWTRAAYTSLIRKRNTQEEYRGYEHAMKSIFSGIPVELVEQEVDDRIYFSKGSGHFEKGMLRFLENKKAMDLVFQAGREKGDHEHE